MRRKTIWGIVGLALLGALFVAFGLWVHAMMPVPIGTCRDTEIYSFDYLGHAGLLSDFRAVCFGRFRHPLFSWIMSLVTILGQRVWQVCGEYGFWVYLCVVFSAIVAGAVALLHRCLRHCLGLPTGEAFACTALFVSFAHVWLLAGVPETYPVSLLLSLLLMNWLFVRLKDRRLELAGWGALGILMGGVTLTQGVKALAAYVVTKRPTRRQIVWGVLGCAGLVALVVLVFYIRLKIRIHFNSAERGMDGAIEELFGPLIGFSASPGEWVHRVWVFFSEPIIVRGEPFDVRTIDGGYGSWIQPLLLTVLYALSVVGAWLGRRHPLVHVLGAMFAVDVGIHIVLGWGLAESQLYASHWFYALPLCIGIGLTNLPARARRWAVPVVLLLALGILLCNAHGYFCHDVGLTWPPANG